MAQAPWHMWGSTQLVDVPPTVPSQPSAQLVNVQFDRPETWSFLFVAFIPNPAATPNTDVRFDVTAGLGRASTSMQGFAKLRAPSGGPLVWTSATFSAGLVDPITDTVANQLIDRFPAQQIQCNAVVLNAPPTGISIQVGAYFAPFSHTRREWFGDLLKTLGARR